ncbi:hypothetical protein BKA65DRAFT_404016 [Rhexocercosporidium sp. MPI-PUGE-AT-0058]|nr:hypothetical protein BKA65DRAFT_404016 [Rhexocercosporidium sp. MPI-PUGE-AT-0058]
MATSPSNLPNGSSHQRDVNEAIVTEASFTNGHLATDSSNSSTSTKSCQPVPIAICGMACRLPGGLEDPGSFWDFLIDKREAICKVPADRFNVDAFHSRVKGNPGTIAMSNGYFLQGDLKHFDPSFFSMSRREIERMDPQHRLLLEVTRECFESAGEKDWRGTKTGCYVGTFGQDWGDIQSADRWTSGLYNVTGQGDFLLSNRISYEYDLKGPSFTVKTACSSSLIALHLACNALKNGECDGALVGGSNLIMAPAMSIVMTDQGIVSPDGRSVSAIYLKRLDDAVRDGSPIRAVIRNTGANCDGKSASLASPSSEAHEALIRSTYLASGLEPSEADVPFVECHGTGTAVGDPLEATAIANVFGQKKTYIGSVKPNVGHSEGASGLTSMIKCIMALENKTIPPNINYSKPNPKIPFATTQLEVPVEAVVWPAGRAERVSVNSFGMGGANAHVILESADSWAASPGYRLRNGVANSDVDNVQSAYGSPASSKHESQLLVLSANKAESLDAMILQYQKYLTSHPQFLKDVAYTLAHHREQMRYRTYAVVVPGKEAVFTKIATNGAKISNITFVFTGQGAQWAQMGKELIETFPIVRSVIQQMDKAINKVCGPQKWRIMDELLRPATDVNRMDDAEFSQPLCTALQIALVTLWRELGIVPDSVVGHSSGEIAAAYAAGSIGVEDAILIAYMRGQVMALGKRCGGMAAVGMAADRVEPLLPKGVVVACENSNASTTVSGDKDTVISFVNKLKAEHPDVFVRMLRVEQAYHSHHMQAIGQQYYDSIAPHIQVCKPKIAFFSTVTGTRAAKNVTLDASYWRRNLESRVRFYAATKNLVADMGIEGRLFLEVGPHSALAGPLRQIFKDVGVSPGYVSSISRGEDSRQAFFQAVGQLWSTRFLTRLGTVCEPGNLLVDLPHYQWHHGEQYWEESRVAQNWRHRKHLPHDLLGTPILESHQFQPTWRRILHLENAEWLRGHQINNDIVFPAAGYIAMAGEAIRELTGVDDYCLRDINISQAMLLDDTRPVEIMTVLRKERLTDSLEGDFYEFDISSFNGKTWIKHCWGKAKPGKPIDQSLDVAIPDLPRVVEQNRFYKSMLKMGLNYSGAFRRLTNIRADPVSNKAVATIPAGVPVSLSESFYTLHPSTVDLIFQALIVAAVRGQARLLTDLSLPTFVSEIYVGGAGAGEETDLQVLADTRETAGNTFLGHAVGVSGSQVVFRLQGLQTSRLDTGEERETDPHAAVQLDWKPHFDFVDPAQLIVPRCNYEDLVVLLEKFMYLSVLDALERVEGVQRTQGYFDKLYQWMQMFVSDAKAGKNQLLPDASEQAALPSKERGRLIESMYTNLVKTPAEFAAVGINRNRLALKEVFEGTIEPLDILMEDQALHKMYEFLSFWDYDAYFKLMAHKTPNLRILEIGAGTGGTTAAVLPTLKTEFGERLYAKYTYTDVSAGFFNKAAEKFAAYDAIEYRTLDITKDPLAQGFEFEGYDLIIAANVLHATPCLRETLSNARKLLHPKGKIFIQELAPVTRWFNFIVGTLPGWWLGETDNRPWEPYVSAQRWDAELKAAGFNGLDTVVYDHNEPYQMNANIIASHVERFPPTPKALTILHAGKVTALQKACASAFVEKAVQVTWHDLLSSSLDDLPKSQDILSVVDLAAPFLDAMTSSEFDSLMALIRHLEAKDCLLWLTHAAQLDCKDPRFAKIIGLARNVRSELAIDMATVELDTIDPMSGVYQVVFELWKNFSGRENHDGSAVKPDFEYAIRKGVPHIPRFHWISVTDELAGAEDISGDYAMLKVGRRGFLNTLHWERRPLAVVRNDEIRIRTRAAGINFKDVLTAMNIVVETTLGYEAAGFVEAVGKDVTGFNVGDRALSVLIHSACGGLGIAAIHLSKMVGAEIYCTVGNEEKRSYLICQFGIPDDHIFDSRSDSFLPDVMNATNGVGVDIVLNSLSGPLLHASWRCVAKFGTMVEVGKRDLLGHGKLDLNPFLDNRNYLCVDLHQLGVNRIDTGHELFQLMMKYLEEGNIQPIRPIKSFAASDVELAFRYMQKGTHIGKVVLEFPDNHHELITTQASPELTFRGDRSYLVTGGFGGLGKATTRWMVSRGAMNIAFLSRSASKNPDTAEFIAELEASGCKVQTFAGSVEDLETVKNVVQQLKKPMAGVLHLAMTLRDQWVKEQTYREWQEVQGPRVVGAWNLHKALLETKTDIEFFVMYGSFSGLVGNWGQANYSASNTFMDAFAQYRRGMGLPATTIDIGVVEEVGYVSNNERVLEYFKAVDALLLTEQSVLDAVELAIRRSRKPVSEPASLGGAYVNPASFGIGLRSYKSLADPSNRLIWKQDRRFCIARNMERTADSGTTASATDGGIAAFVARAETDPSLLDDPSAIDFVAHETGRVLFGFLLRPEEEIVLDQTLGTLGVDSLVSIEIRNWCRQRLRLEMSVLEIMSASLQDIGRAAVANLSRSSNNGGELPGINGGGERITQEERERWENLIAMKAP